MSSPASPAGAANVSGMSTAHFIHSVSNQIGEIQSRRLPEPPTDEGLASLGIGTIKEEVDDEEEAYVEIERTDSGRGTLVSRFRTPRTQSEKNGETSHFSGIRTRTLQLNGSYEEPLILGGSTGPRCLARPFFT